MWNMAVLQPQSIRLASPSPHSMPLVVLWCWGTWWCKNEWSCGGSGTIGSGEGYWVWGQGTRRPPVGCVCVCVMCVVCMWCVWCVCSHMLAHPQRWRGGQEGEGIGKLGGKSAPTALPRALPGQLLSWFLFDKAFACWLGVYLNGFCRSWAFLALTGLGRLVERGLPHPAVWNWICKVPSGPSLLWRLAGSLLHYRGSRS